MVTTDSRKQRVQWLWAVIGLLVGGVLLGLIAILSALGFRDPTEDAFAVTLRNDTMVPVLLKQCDVRCNEFHEQDRLTPGGTVPVNTGLDTPNWWVVQDASGRVLGCLNLQYKQKQTGIVVNVSAVMPCPGEG